VSLIFGNDFLLPWDESLPAYSELSLGIIPGVTTGLGDTQVQTLPSKREVSSGVTLRQRTIYCQLWEDWNQILGKQYWEWEELLVVKEILRADSKEGCLLGLSGLQDFRGTRPRLSVVLTLIVLFSHPLPGTPAGLNFSLRGADCQSS
jgi:hypothetical protein